MEDSNALLSYLYVAADLNLFSQEMAKQFNVSIEEYNQHVIECWNKVIANEDRILLLGNITYGTAEETKAIISQLKGKKQIIDYRTSSTQFDEDTWKDIGISSLITVSGYIDGIIDGNPVRTIIAADKSILSYTMKRCYYAAAESLINSKEMYKKGILNLSLYHWGFTPIRYDTIPNLIDNQIIFEQMENKEENLNE